MIDEFEADAAVVRVLAPGQQGSVEVVGEVAALDQPLAAVLDLQTDVEAPDVDVLQRHAGDALGRDTDAFVVLGVALPRANHPGPAAVDGDVRCLEDDRAVGLSRIEDGVLADFQRRLRPWRRHLRRAIATATSTVPSPQSTHFRDTSKSEPRRKQDFAAIAKLSKAERSCGGKIKRRWAPFRDSQKSDRAGRPLQGGNYRRDINTGSL